MNPYQDSAADRTVPLRTSGKDKDCPGNGCFLNNTMTSIYDSICVY